MLAVDVIKVLEIITKHDPSARISVNDNDIEIWSENEKADPKNLSVEESDAIRSYGFSWYGKRGVWFY